jgi:hypothetical protein
MLEPAVSCRADMDKSKSHKSQSERGCPVRSGRAHEEQPADIGHKYKREYSEKPVSQKHELFAAGSKHEIVKHLDKEFDDVLEAFGHCFEFLQADTHSDSKNNKYAHHYPRAYQGIRYPHLDAAELQDSMVFNVKINVRIQIKLPRM